MNIQELDSYDLGDAVKFNERLNPRLFGPDERLRPEVREQLLKIADDFREFLGIKDLQIKDITVSGSNAAYTYTPHSDIDLHLVVDLPEADASEVYRELFDAKKYAYNDQHAIRIGGYDVELYVQDARKTHHSQGIYSVAQDDWVSVPKRRRPDVDDISVKAKFEDLGHRIEEAIASGDYERISTLSKKIKEYRQAGLDEHGEFGAENLAFKMLRNQGLIQKLIDARNSAKDRMLSLDERRKKKKSKKVRYGYGGYWYPGTAYAGQDHPAGTEGGGGDGGGGESIREDVSLPSDEQILRDFVDFCVKELKIEHMPQVKLRRDPQWSAVHRTFGRYSDDTKTLEVAWGQRHIMDVLRTVAHELTHKHQHEREGERMGPDAGETGSPYENEANARAGVLMRDYGRLHPEYFTVGQAHDLHADKIKETAFADSDTAWKQQVRQLLHNYQTNPFLLAQIAQEKGAGSAEAAAYDYMLNPQGRIALPTGDNVKESASGYIPTKRQAKDPRYSMALTVDIKPGQVGKEANKLKLKTDRQGHPQIARANGLFETLMAEYALVKEGIQAPVGKNQDAEQYYKFILGKARLGRPLTRQEQDYVKMYQVYRQQKLAEFAPSPERDDNDDVPDQLLVLANRWWNATDRQPQIEHVLNSLGWSIHQVESEDDAVQLQHRDGTTHFISADDFDPDLFEYQKPKIQRAHRAGIELEAWRDGLNFQINATAHGRELGRVLFDVQYQGNDPVLVAKDLMIHPEYRGQGIAAVMYDYAKELGYHVERSSEQTDAGKHFWDKNRGKEGQVWETKLDEISDELRRSYLGRAGQQVDRRQTRMAQVRDRLNKGYEIYHAEDPTRIVHRFEADTPQEARRYYERYDADYDSDVDYDLQLRRATGLMESEELDEVNMSPGALEKFAASPAAKGIRAGFEAELIFRDTQGESDEMDPEPDYDADERAYSIQQVIEFFENDEYGYGLSDRQRNRLEEQLDETYMNWRDEQMISDFRNEAEDLVREIYLNETPMGERIIKVLTDGMEIDDARADQILIMGMDAPRFTTSKEQEAYAEQNPDYKIYLEAVDDAEAILDEEVETSIEKQDGYYDQAIDDYRDNYAGDDDSFFSDVGLRWMSDIANEFNLDWPVWNMDSRGNSGSRDWETIGALLQDAVDMPVKVSTNYHSTTRREGQWIIEPDGSLSPDDPDDEAGLEIVSPPMPLLVALEKLRQVTDWANDPKTGNAYTNSSTGLHMGVSLPKIQVEDDGKDAGIDYVKLILFMGDKYILDKFGRSANTYTASALEKFKQNIRGKRSDPAGVVKLLQHGLTELAHRELQKGVGTSKYTSAHIQDGYIEFRSPGGDWLAKADEEIGVLENTMLRFARAMAIAGDPSAERQEYAKKLYKLVTADNEQYADQLRLFSEYSAGTISKEQLKKQWAEKTIGTEKKMNQRWKLYQKVNGTWSPVPGAEWNGYTEDEVKMAVWGKYGREALDTGEYQLVNMGEQEWEVYDVKTGKTLEVVKGKSKGEVADAVYDKYVDQGIGFNVRPYEDPSKLTPRTKLAKRIVKPQAPAVGDDEASDWEAVYKPTGRVFDTLAHADTAQAKTWIQSAMRNHQFTNADDILLRRVGHKQAADARRDSTSIQRNLGVQDVEPDVAQNFAPDYSAYERNSDRIDAIRARARQPRQNYELVQHDDTDRVIHRMNDATADEVRAWIAQQEAGGMPAGFLRTRIVAEAIDPVSGAGAISPRPVIKKKSTERVEPVEPVVRSPKPRSAIGQAISLSDVENMTQQIQMARRLGDDVTENFADGKVKGKSRPGRVKRAGASCNGSVTDLRRRARAASGEKAKMYHWCANMKSGRKK